MFLSAYGEETGEEATEDIEKVRSSSDVSDVSLPKDIEKRLRSGTVTMRDRKNKLEKLDLKPLAFEVPKVPASPKKVERRAPDGEEEISIQDGLSSPLKKFSRKSHNESRLSGHVDTETKRHSSFGYVSKSNEKSSQIDSDSELQYPTVIRRKPRQSRESVDDDSFVMNPSYDAWEDSNANDYQEKRRSRTPRKELPSPRHSYEEHRNSRTAESSSDLNRNKDRTENPVRSGTISPEDLRARRASLRKSRNHEEEYRKAHGYRSEGEASARANHNKVTNRVRAQSSDETSDAPRNLSRKSVSSTSLRHNQFSYEDNDDVFERENELVDRRPSRHSSQEDLCEKDYNRNGVRRRSGKGRVPGDRSDDDHRSRRSQRSLANGDYRSDEWEVDVDVVSVPSTQRVYDDDENERDYRRLVRDLTKDRSRTMYDDEYRDRDMTDRRARSKSQKGL